MAGPPPPHSPTPRFDVACRLSRDLTLARSILPHQVVAAWSTTEASIIEDHTERKENPHADGSGGVLESAATRLFDLHCTIRQDRPSYKYRNAQPIGISRRVAIVLIHYPQIGCTTRTFLTSHHKRISLTASAMKFFVLCALFALAVAQPAKNENWKNAMNEMVDRSRSECSQKSDEIACMKFKVFNLLDQIFSKDNFKVGISNAGSGFLKRFTQLSYFYSIKIL